MKKIYYEFADDGRITIHCRGGVERFLVTISSSATPDNLTDTLTAETNGYSIGPANLDDDAESFAELVEFARKEWKNFEEMSEEETKKRLGNLSEEWGLGISDVDYLN